MLVELGVTPYASFEENHQLLTQTREDEDGNRYLFAYNYCPNDYHQNSSKEEVRTEDHGTNITTDVCMDGLYVPYVIDPWTGEVTELAEYSWVDGTNTICIVYNSSITNAALAAGIIQEQGIGDGHAWYGAVAIYWPHVIAYRSNGPAQAKLVPYVDIPVAE